jgi:hypothetical protein
MKYLIKLTFIVIFTFCFAAIHAQEKSPVKFGKISPEDFDLSKYTFDTTSSAVVISDIGSSEFEGNAKGWFSLIYKHVKRVKILNKIGFEAANVEIPLYSNGTDEEKLINLKAYTYNIENGKIVKTELGSDGIFKDKLSKNFVNKKFTFPAVKEGSIIEYSYTIKSDFLFNLQPWSFQGGYPRIWSEYNVSMPEFFNYVVIGQGYQSFFINTKGQSASYFSIIDPGGAAQDSHISFRSTVADSRWVMKDVPALKEEPFTSTLENHIAKIEFQLSQYLFPNSPVRDIMGNWLTVSKKMLASEDFGEALKKNNNWLDDDMKKIVAGSVNQLDKAKHIYDYVRDNFTCTDHSDLYLNNNLKTILKNKNGSVADINLLLITMLRHENIEADPVILSTRDNGFTHQLYPLISRFNYVIAEARINDSAFYLDATEPMLGFGKLPVECYNGYARRIHEVPALLNFTSDVLSEKKVTTVFILPNDKGELEGSFTTIPGYYESYNIRKKIKEKGEADFFKKISSAYGSDFQISHTVIDSLKSIEKPVTINYEFKMNNSGESTIYLNPLMGEENKANIFKAAERKYPVEMPYTFDEIYILNMEVPANYTIEEIPKSTKVAFNDDEGYFEYLISNSGNNIQMRSRIKMNKANFMPEDYNSLREFFGFIVKKQSEQIVLKKKK